MSKIIKGDDIKVYQGGEPIGIEFNCHYSDMLQFIAVEAYYTDQSSSKMVEVKLDGMVLYSDTFKHCKIIHSARHSEAATSLFIFHNGDSDILGSSFSCIMDFIKMEKSNETNNNILKIKAEMKKSNSVKPPLPPQPRTVKGGGEINTLQIAFSVGLIIGGLIVGIVLTAIFL